MNESNAKVPTHYCIVCLYSKNVSFDVFIPEKFFNFFRNILCTKTIKVNNFTPVTKQSNSMCTYVCIFIKIYYVNPILFLGLIIQIISWIDTIKPIFHSIIPFYLKICQRKRRHQKSYSFPQPALTILFPLLLPEPALTIPFPDNKFPRKI